MADKPNITKDSEVTLREVNADTVRTICNLDVTETQKQFVAPNAVSIAQAHFSDKAWFRAIYADEEPVGFAMLYEDHEKPEYYLWRFMIDQRYQKFGFGWKAMDLLIDRVRSHPKATCFETSVVEADGGPGPFYERLGFKYTGGYEDDEAVMRLEF